jgi:acyl-CoA synthetase (AMP-forming)/AMP-acid ligase II
MTGTLDRCVISRIVRRAAERDPDHVAFVFENGNFPDEPVTFADLSVRGNQLAHRFRADGLAKGDRVAIMLRNHPEFLYGLVATSKLGLETVPVDPRARREKLRYFLQFSDSKAVVVADYVLEDSRVVDLISELGLRTYVLATAEGPSVDVNEHSGWIPLGEVFAEPNLADVGEHVDDVNDSWLLSFTSGTMGDPKAILFTYARMELYQLLPGWFGYRPEDVPYTGLSLTHGNAILVTLMPALWGRVDHSVFSRWFTRSRIWDLCREYGVTTWSNLGGIATAVYSNRPSSQDLDHQVRLICSAGMPPQLWEPFEQRFGVRVLEWYGTMEGGFAYNPVGFGPIGSFGKPPGDVLEMALMDQEGRLLEAEADGELLVRPIGGETRMHYYKNPTASAQKVRDGWLRTGDTVHRDAHGWLFFLNRMQDGGLRKMGEFIQEGFVRRAVAEHDAVADVHVYGVAAASGAPGETDIVAAVIAASTDRIDPAALFEHCAGRLEPSHVPDLIQVVDEFPLTPSAKVQTRLLVLALEEEQATVFRKAEFLSMAPGRQLEDAR